jgi:hypothetical protein
MKSAKPNKRPHKQEKEIQALRKEIQTLRLEVATLYQTVVNATDFLAARSYDADFTAADVRKCPMKPGHANVWLCRYEAGPEEKKEILADPRYKALRLRGQQMIRLDSK